MTALIGYTGFVGSNIFANGKIDAAYNSKNIAESFGTRPDILIFAGLRAEKFLANKNASADFALVEEAERNIEKIAPKKLVLISTIDVFKNSFGKDENSALETDGLQPYGLNRLHLEKWSQKNFPNCLIIRLPALYGINLKKNFIYDFINVIPSMLNKEKFAELSQMDSSLEKFYSLQENGFFKLNEISIEQKKSLKEKFRSLNFTALNFTDSRSRFQFYPLKRLWNDIQTALKNDITIFHAATEPVSAGELYEFLTGKEFENELFASPANYDFRTVHAKVFGGAGGYVLGKRGVMEDVGKFVGKMTGGVK